MLGTRRRRDYEKRKEKKLLCAFTAGPSTQYQNERNTAHQDFSDTITFTAKIRRNNQRQHFLLRFYKWWGTRRIEVYDDR